MLERAAAARLAHLRCTRRIPRKAHDRFFQGLRFPGRNEETRDAVLDELAQTADLGRNHRSCALHRLERDHAETFAHRGDDDDRGVLDRLLHRRDVAQETDRVPELELHCKGAQRRLQRTPSRDVELQVRNSAARCRERSQQHDVTLDRDQTTDAEQHRHGPGVGTRRTVGLDAVVNDLEARAVEALHLFEVTGEPA